MAVNRVMASGLCLVTLKDAPTNQEKKRRSMRAIFYEVKKNDFKFQVIEMNKAGAVRHLDLVIGRFLMGGDTYSFKSHLMSI